MLIHDLYPVGLAERVVEALDSVRPYMESHGGNVELLGIEDGIARIRLEGSCDGCPASASTLELAIKSALDEAAPDLEGLVVEGAVRRRAGDARVRRGSSCRWSRWRRPPPRARRRGSTSAASSRLGEGELTSAERRRLELIVARVEGSLLAFRDAAPAAASRSRGGELERGDARLPRLRAALLPAPRRALARRRPAAARAGAAARRRRRRPGGAAGLAPRDERVARRQARRPPSGGDGRRACGGWRARRPRRRHRRRHPQRRLDRGGGARALRPLRQAARSRPSPPAPPGRPPDPLHLRELPGAARRRPGAAPDRHAHACGSTTSTLSDEAWASFGIPIGLAFFIDSSATGGIVALYPSPAGATESELEIESLARAARRRTRC